MFAGELLRHGQEAPCHMTSRQDHLIMVADEHQGGLLPVPELLKHPVERVHRQGAPHMPEVTCNEQGIQCKTRCAPASFHAFAMAGIDSMKF